MLSWTFSTGRWFSGWIGTNVSVHHASPFPHAKSNGRGATTGLAARHYGTYCGRNGAISAHRRTIWTHTGTSSTAHHILVVSTKRTRYLHVQFIVQVSEKLEFETRKKKRKVVCRKTSFQESTIFFLYWKCYYYGQFNVLTPHHWDWHISFAMNEGEKCFFFRFRRFERVDKNTNCIFFSFCVCCRVTSANAGEAQNLSFCKGLKLLETNCVENVLQVGESRFDYSQFSLYIVVSRRSLWLIDST